MKPLVISRVIVLRFRNSFLQLIRIYPSALVALLLGAGIWVFLMRGFYIKTYQAIQALGANPPELLYGIVTSSGIFLFVIALWGGVFLERLLSSRSQIQTLLAAAPVHSSTVFLGELIPYSALVGTVFFLCAGPVLIATAAAQEVAGRAPALLAVAYIIPACGSTIGLAFSRFAWATLRGLVPLANRFQLTLLWLAPVGGGLLALMSVALLKLPEVSASAWNPVHLGAWAMSLAELGWRPLTGLVLLITMASTALFALRWVRELPIPEAPQFSANLVWSRLMRRRTMSVVVSELGRTLRDFKLLGQALLVSGFLFAGVHLVQLSPYTKPLTPLYTQLTLFCVAIMAGLIPLASRGRDQALSWLPRALPIRSSQYTVGKGIGSMSLALMVVSTYIMAVTWSTGTPLSKDKTLQWLLLTVTVQATAFLIGHLAHYIPKEQTKGIVMLGVLSVANLTLMAGIQRLVDWMQLGLGVPELMIIPGICLLFLVLSPLAAAGAETWRWRNDL